MAPPSAALDSGIDAAKVTVVSPAPPPPAKVVIRPPSPVLIARRAAEVPVSAAHFERARAAIDRGLAWLRSSQGPNGGWLEETQAKATDQVRASAAAPLAITGLVLRAFSQRDAALRVDPAVTRGIEFVRRGAWRDGRFDPDPTGSLGNYVAASIALGLVPLGTQQSGEMVRECVAWLKANQWTQAKGVSPDQDWYGGAGYGNGRRPDLSNTQVFLDALNEAGVSATDPSVQKALVFVSRCQNLTQFNASEWCRNGRADGGMVYTPANGGESMASAAAGEGRAGEQRPAGAPRSLRSYGSMTYAGFKSLLYAGLDQDDPRVRSALEWLLRHWTFAENPGMGQEGRYYYLHAMSRALLASGRAMIVTPDGVEHNWREELIDAIGALQSEDGSFRNSAERWMESRPELATAYLVLALEEAIKPVLQVEE
ncbi:MAG: terpene cyclase/mutase family protein [Phycisphaerae bacterium]|nr:terpene cyclase/mutase family protein [Phycisphaerae bacterium]